MNPTSNNEGKRQPVWNFQDGSVNNGGHNQSQRDKPYGPVFGDLVKNDGHFCEPYFTK
jgi:hypothetical protein